MTAMIKALTTYKNESYEDTREIDAYKRAAV